MYTENLTYTYVYLQLSPYWDSCAVVQHAVAYFIDRVASAVGQILKKKTFPNFPLYTSNCYQKLLQNIMTL